MKHAVIRVKLGAFAAGRAPADPSQTTIFREASVAYSPPVHQPVLKVEKPQKLLPSTGSKRQSSRNLIDRSFSAPSHRELASVAEVITRSQLIQPCRRPFSQVSDPGHSFLILHRYRAIVARHNAGNCAVSVQPSAVMRDRVVTFLVNSAELPLFRHLSPANFSKIRLRRHCNP